MDLCFSAAFECANKLFPVISPTFFSPASSKRWCLPSPKTSAPSKPKYGALKTVLASLAVAGAIGGVVYFGKRILTVPELSEYVKESALEGHLKEFEAIAKANHNSRSPLNGYNDSASYIVKQLKEKTNYQVTVQTFNFPQFESITPPKLNVAGLDLSLTPGKDFDAFANSGSGAVKNAVITAIRSGCSPKDFDGFQPGSVALVSSGSDCLYRTKISNAVKAQAGAVLYYTTLPYGGPPLGRANPDTAKTPVLAISHATALAILQQIASSVGGVPVRVDLESNVHFKNVTTVNVIADTPGGDPDKIIVAGSHLDSVPQGPGINDDGSGSAATLEVALQLYKTGLSRKLKNKVRFAWWSAEELGLLGSNYYVDDLAANHPEELKKIVLNLNNDMIGSPNGGRFIYNGRAAENEALRQPSGVIQGLFESFFDRFDMYYEPTPFDGRSDYGGFLRHGIPAGGLFTGAEQLKTEEQAKKWGGTPGIPYDPCYHQACDTLDTVKRGDGLKFLSELAAAMGFIVQKLSLEKDINALLYSNATTA
ncbi:hypothetical protein HDU96_002294 [Phlyctochytrium bullatum]|nr:hypothetical protein HDU96_002294 [Phlyctochytrium bullatum]